MPSHLSNFMWINTCYLSSNCNRNSHRSNATGAVFAIKQRPAAYKGFNPRPARSAAVIATGAPNPAAPSKMLQMKIQLK